METLSWKLAVGRATYYTRGSRGEQLHAQSVMHRTMEAWCGEEAVVTANVGSGEGKTSPSRPLPQQHLFQLCLASLATSVCQQPALSFQLSQNYMKKLYLYYIKTVSGGLVGVGLEVGLLCSSGQGWVGFFFFFTVTEKIKQSAVQQRLLRLYPSFPPHQLTQRGPLFQASANTAPSGGRLPGQGPWHKFYCAHG